MPYFVSQYGKYYERTFLYNVYSFYINLLYNKINVSNILIYTNSTELVIIIQNKQNRTVQEIELNTKIANL